MSPNIRGIAATLAASLFFVTSDTMVKLTAPHLPLGEIMALRGMALLGLLLVLTHAGGHWRHLRALANPYVLARSLLEAGVAYLFLSALVFLPLANVTAIFLTSPLILTAVSALFLGETVGWRRWSAVSLGFLGMLLVVKPTPSDFNFAALYGLASATLAAGRDLTTRRINPATPSLIVTIGASLTVALLGALLYPFENWQAPARLDITRLLASAAAVGCGTFSIITAYRSAEASVISPFRYAVVILSLAIGYAVWGDVPDGWAFAGIVLILVANLYIIHRERVRRRAHGR